MSSITIEASMPTVEEVRAHEERAQALRGERRGLHLLNVVGHPFHAAALLFEPRRESRAAHSVADEVEVEIELLGQAQQSPVVQEILAITADNARDVIGDAALTDAIVHAQKTPPEELLSEHGALPGLTLIPVEMTLALVDPRRRPYSVSISTTDAGENGAIEVSQTVSVAHQLLGLRTVTPRIENLRPGAIFAERRSINGVKMELVLATPRESGIPGVSEVQQSPAQATFSFRRAIRTRIPHAA